MACVLMPFIADQGLSERSQSPPSDSDSYGGLPFPNLNGEVQWMRDAFQVRATFFSSRRLRRVQERAETMLRQSREDTVLGEALK